MQRSVALFASVILVIVAFSTTGCRNRSGPQSTICKADADCENATPFCTPDGVCVECFETTQCGCHQQCLDTVCQELGANQPNQALNAHGNWVGTPGQPNYEFKDACTESSDCGIGQICNPLTSGCVMASQFVDDCNPEDANDCPIGPNGEALVCEPTSQKCMPAPSCLETFNCCGHESLICDSGAQICQAIADECTPPTEITTTCPLEPKNQDSCLPGYFCSLAGTCVQCTCDADCNSSGTSGLKCHLSTHTCKSADYCDTAADCNQPTESCDRTTNLCAPSCSVENELTDCGLNFFCDPNDKVCRSKADLPCSEDDYSPNDSSSTAAPLTLPEVNSTRPVTDLSVCNGDDDWFALSMEAGNRLVITMSSPDASMTATYSIFSSDGESQLAEGVLNPGGSQLLDFTANTTGQYYLKIDPTGDSEGWYSLSLAMHHGELCEDSFESSSSNESADSATVLLNEGTQTAPTECLYETTSSTSFVRCASSVLKICLGDVDYYEITLSQSSRLEVTIKDYLGDLDFLVYGPFADGEAFDSSRIAGGEGLSQALVKTVETIARNGSRYFVKIAGGPGAESAYTLETRVTQIDNCVEDSFDATQAASANDPSGQNDTASNASGILLTNDTPTDFGGSLCVGDADWFKLGIDDGNGGLSPMPSGHRVELELITTNEDAGQAITMAAGTNASALELGSLAPSSPIKNIAIPLSSGADYFVGIVGAASNSNVVEYTLRATLITPPSCAADTNDAPSTATVLTAPSAVGEVITYSEDAASCLGEDDWYTIDIPDNSQLLATVTYDPSITDLGLVLFDSSVSAISDPTAGTFPTTGELARSNVEGRGFQQIRKAFSDSGYLVVNNRGQWNLTDYDLSLELIPADCTADGYTSEGSGNQTLGTAAEITLSQDALSSELYTARVEPLSLCNADEEDWYKITLLPGDRIDVSAYYQRPEGGAAEGDLDLALYHPALPDNPLATDSDDGSGILKVGAAIQGDGATDYRLKVTANEETGFYNLDIQVIR